MKYICTLGPSILDEKILLELHNLGVSYFRINLSHKLPYTDKFIKMIRKINEKNKCKIKLIFDIQGGETRLLLKKHLEVKKDKQIILDKNNFSNNNLYNQLNINDTLVIGDNEIFLKVSNIKGERINCISLNSGIIKNNQKIWHKNFTYNKENDNVIKEQLDIVKKYKPDCVAISFTNSCKDIQFIKKCINNKKIKTIAKIESLSGIENIDEILKACDYLMIARGDLFVATQITNIAFYQKYLAKKAWKAGKKIIIGTGFAQNLMNNNYPSISEILDLYNAVFTDKIDLIMFSGEIALSNNPINFIKTINKIMKKEVL